MKSYCGNESARKRIVERGHKRCTDGEYAYMCIASKLLSTP
jgi:hypothetical protein